MEGWQVNNIVKNLPELQSWTKCNTQLLAKLQAGNVLGEDDIQAIKCEKKPNCKAEMLYDILRTRKDAYYILAKAVIETKQTGAAELLLEIPTEKIGELKVLFMGTQNSVKSLLNPDQIKSIQSWLQQNASLEERLQIQTVLDQKAALKLLLDTIPDPDPLYIPRFLICRQAVNPKVFQQECPDVFVFRNASQMELRKVINSYGIEYSSRELLQREIRVRFLILDVDANWNKICSKVNSPVHLIRYEKEIQRFLLEETSGDSNILREYLEHNQEVEGRSIGRGSCNSPQSVSVSKNGDASNNESEKDFGSGEIKKTMHANKSEHDDDNVGIFEDRFVKMIMEQNVNYIGICDLPGMGKSYLLASLARKINSEYPDRIVAFIQLQNFKLASNSSTDTLENSQSQLLGQLATSKLSQCILLELVKCKSVKLELFFDGLDEVQQEYLESLLVFFETLAKPESMPKTRIFVTSRPALQAKLQTALRVIAYDIKPFNAATQLRYIATQWAQAEPDSVELKLRAYAQFCLNSFETFLKTKKNNITGIPLQCKLIADVYSSDAGVYANKSCKIPIELPQNFPTSLFEIYSKFLGRQLGSANCNFACFYKNNALEALCTEECRLRNFHVLQALRLIFPHLSVLIEKFVFNNFDDLHAHKILSPGILRESNHAPNFQFVHRTYAEYLVAEYFWKGVWLNSNDSLTAIQSAFVKNMEMFVINEGLAYFLDCMITEYQKNVKVQLHCTASTSPVNPGYKDFLKKCIVCGYTGLLELCFKATENHKLNGKTRPVRSFWLFGNSKKCSKPAIEWKAANGKYKKLTHFIDPGRLLTKAATYCNVTTFDRIYTFFIEVFYIDARFLYLDRWSSPIVRAVNRADFELVQYLSTKMALENQELLYECLWGTYFDTIELVEKKVDIATFLLAKCPSLLTESCLLYKTPIHAKEIHLELLKVLVRSGCDILVPNWEGYSIVYSASKFMSDDDFFELCRFMCFECKARDFFLNPANWVEYVSDFPHWVERYPTKSFFRILCNLDLETDFVQNNSFLSKPKVYEKHMEVFHSLIYSAFKDGKLDFANIILSLDSYLLRLPVYLNVNLHGTDTLHFITATREKLFVSKESNIFAVSSEGETILHIAARTEDCNFFNAILCMLGELWNETQDIKGLKTSISQRALMGKTAPENLVELFNWHENEDLETPLHYAIQYLEDLSLETLDILLSCGNKSQAKTKEFTLVDINAVNINGDNALSYATRWNQRLELVRHLVNKGADWTSIDICGCNITHICAIIGRVDHLKYFVELGSNVNQPDNDGNNALQCAMKRTFWFWKEYVLNGRNPTHIISGIIQVLIDAGVDKSHKNKAGKSAYDLALDSKYPKAILNMLKKWKQTYLL